MDDNTAHSRILVVLIVAVVVFACVAVMGYHWKEVRFAEEGLYYQPTPRYQHGAWLPGRGK